MMDVHAQSANCNKIFNWNFYCQNFRSAATSLVPGRAGLMRTAASMKFLVTRFLLLPSEAASFWLASLLSTLDLRWALLGGLDLPSIFQEVELKPRRLLDLKTALKLGSGGSASGRVSDFCLSGPGSIPGSTLAFFGQTVSILAGRWAFSIRTNHRTQKMSSYSLLSCFLSSISIKIVCPTINCNQYTKREKNFSKSHRLSMTIVHVSSVCSETTIAS